MYPLLSTILEKKRNNKPLHADSKKLAWTRVLLVFAALLVFQTWRLPSLDKVTSTHNIGSHATDIIGCEPTCVLQRTCRCIIKN